MPETPPLQPYDVHNRFLVSNVHPPDWGNALTWCVHVEHKPNSRVTWIGGLSP